MSSFGSILLYDGSSGQSLTSSPVKLTSWTKNGLASSFDHGDLAVIPDFANGRIKVKPGTYLAVFRASGKLSGVGADVLNVNIFKNGQKVWEIGYKLNQYADPTDVQVITAGVLLCRLIDANVNGDVVVDVRASASVGVTLTLALASLTLISFDD